MKKLLLFILTLGLFSFGYSAAADESDQTAEKSMSKDNSAADSINEDAKKHPTLYDIRKAIVERHSRNKWKTNYETRWYKDEVEVKGKKKSFYNYVIVEKSKKSTLKRETLYRIEMNGEIPKTVEVRSHGRKLFRARKVKEFIRASYNPLSKAEIIREKKAIAKEEQGKL